MGKGTRKQELRRRRHRRMKALKMREKMRTTGQIKEEKKA